VTEQHIRRIMQLVFEGGEIGREELVSALHSIATVTTPQFTGGSNVHVHLN